MGCVVERRPFGERRLDQAARQCVLTNQRKGLEAPWMSLAVDTPQGAADRCSAACSARRGDVYLRNT